MIGGRPLSLFLLLSPIFLLQPRQCTIKAGKLPLFLFVIHHYKVAVGITFLKLMYLVLALFFASLLYSEL